jgi:acetylornithine/succinyldiaminopimelate/putrescine aminotransferase
MILKANNNTLRLAPALTISEKEIQLGIKKLEKSLLRLI